MVVCKWDALLINCWCWEYQNSDCLRKSRTFSENFDTKSLILDPSLQNQTKVVAQYCISNKKKFGQSLDFNQKINKIWLIDYFSIGWLGSDSGGLYNVVIRQILTQVINKKSSKSLKIIVINLQFLSDLPYAYLD